MRHKAEDIASHIPADLHASLGLAGIESFLERLPDAYFSNCTPADTAKHIAACASLSEENHLAMLCEELPKNRLDITVIAADFAGAFALIAGAMAAEGFDIQQGDIFTLSAVANKTESRRSFNSTHQVRLTPKAEIKNRKLLLDRFEVVAPEQASGCESPLARLHIRLSSVFLLAGEGRLDEARASINQGVADRLRQIGAPSASILYPVELELDNEQDEARTVISLRGEDTFAFLYACANALSLRHVYIDTLKIRTHKSAVEDVIFVTDSDGKLTGGRLREIRLAMLLTKQFTHFLPQAPDPYLALTHFDQLLDHLLEGADDDDALRQLRDPRVLQGLARLLGASDFLWHDFIRLQYESLLPIVADNSPSLSRKITAESLTAELDRKLAAADDKQALADAINSFKDTEAFRSDLANILDTLHGIDRLSEELTLIADVTLNAAMRLAYSFISEEHGLPFDVGGRPCPFALFGLGKLGGRELGYASDIELMLLYADNGYTSGEKRISNQEFFDKVVQELRNLIRAPRDGIFELDLRLRPHGQSGPLAVSLDSFVSYYGQCGEALDYERLALSRLRLAAGDAAFGHRIIGIRDDILYLSHNISLQAVAELREKQFAHKCASGKLNAKFSSGGLVDLEYAIQLLQVQFGGEHPEVRVPGSCAALEALATAGCLTATESGELQTAYKFLRSLINGMRMLRGHAKDLELPDVGTPEFSHLARRMGYEAEGGLSAPDRLLIDIERHMAASRSFFQTRFHAGVRVTRAFANLADLVLNRNLDDDTANSVLSGLGFRECPAARRTLERLSSEGVEAKLFAHLAVMAQDMLRRNPDPDMALSNLERVFESAGNRISLYSLLLAQPRQLEVLLGICGGSNFLVHTITRAPELFDWLVQPEILLKPKTGADYRRALDDFLGAVRKKDSKLRQLRRFRRREMLRIGARDLCLNVKFTETVRELSDLADTLVQAALDIEIASEVDGQPSPLPPPPCAVYAFGKHGGRELNYSSDIDLVFIYAGDPNDAALNERFTKLAQGMIHNIDENGEEGYVYRVDMRLRPFGGGGSLVCPAENWIKYYQENASTWEYQALLKVRPVAGDLALGQSCLERLRPLLISQAASTEVAAAARRLREITLGNLAAASNKFSFHRGLEIKNGPGGIRDIEFGAQILQRIHASAAPQLLDANTLAALEKLSRANIINQERAQQLSESYILLRRVEHLLQIMDDRQLHLLADNDTEMDRVAGRLGMGRSSGSKLREKLRSSMELSRAFYLEVTGQTPAS